MSRSRYAPHKIRSRYLRALSAMPIPVALPDPVDPERLTVLGTATVDDREVHFGTMANAPRMWLAFQDIDPALLGYVSGLVVGEPDLWVCDPVHQEWTTQGRNAAELKQAAVRVWFACQRDCEG